MLTLSGCLCSSWPRVCPSLAASWPLLGAPSRCELSCTPLGQPPQSSVLSKRVAGHVLLLGTKRFPLARSTYILKVLRRLLLWLLVALLVGARPDGACCGCCRAVSVIFPLLAYLKLFGATLPRGERYWNYFVVGIGIVCAVAGTVRLPRNPCHRPQEGPSRSR